MAMIFILFLCVMFNFSFSESRKVEFFIDGEKVTQQEFAEKGKNGTIIFYYENGNKRDELEFKNGPYHGKCTKWYEGTRTRKINQLV